MKVLMVNTADNSIKFTWSTRSLAASSGRVAAAPRVCLRSWSMAVCTLCAVLWFLLVSISQSSEIYSSSLSSDSAKIRERYSYFIGNINYISRKLLSYIGVGFTFFLFSLWMCLLFDGFLKCQMPGLQSFFSLKV